MPHTSDPNVVPLMRGRFVLVAERYQTPRVLVMQMVRTLGYPARSCPTGQDALAFLRLHPGSVQCLLSDLGLPDMDGGELVERAQDIIPGLRVVLMVASDHPRAVELLQGYHDLPCLTKPVNGEQLAHTLKALLGPPRPWDVTSSSRTPRRPRTRRRSSSQHER